MTEEETRGEEGEEAFNDPLLTLMNFPERLVPRPLLSLRLPEGCAGDPSERRPPLFLLLIRLLW